MTKPAVAFLSEQKARENIDRKLRRLALLLDDGSQIIDAPKSLTQFNAWTSKSGEAGESFVSNAHATLTRLPDLKIAAANLTGLAKKAGKPIPKVREISVNRAREKGAVHLSLRRIAERHALQVMAENGELRRQVEALRAQVNSIVDELGAIRNSYEEEIQKLTSRNAQLVRVTSPKVRSLRKDAE